VRMVSPLGKRWWAILLLSVACVLLLVLIGIIKRFHERTVTELYVNHLKITQRIFRLADVIGQATQIDRLYDNKEDEAPKEVFETWVAYLKMALRNTFGETAVSDFTDGHPESLDVTDHQHVWFLFLREQLSQLVDRQTKLIKQAKLDHDRLSR